MKLLKRNLNKSWTVMLAGALSVANCVAPQAVFAQSNSTQIIQFEDVNKFSSDSGNGIRNDFSDYSGSGYVYLASGWAEVNFTVPEDGEYRITVVTNSDQYKENWLYLDNDGAGKVYTEGNKWTATTNQYTLSKGEHKFGVSSDWGYVGLDYVIVEPVNGGSTETPDVPETPETPDVPETPENPPAVDPGETEVPSVGDEKVTCEFEKANSFSDDYGNKIANDEFAGYTGDGYVYLASGWADVKFNVETAGTYKITVRSNSDQYKENNVYVDSSTLGQLKTEANTWTTAEYEVKLSAGEHKVGVSTNWGYVALDNITIEKVGESVTPPAVATGSMNVQGTKLYDGLGNEFVMRGINIAHAWYTDKTETSINAVADLGANTVRVVLADGAQWTKTTAQEVEDIIKWSKERGLVCVLEVHDHTGKNDPAELDIAVNYWIELKDLLNANKDYVIVNIANEWLGEWNKGDVWENTYKNAVTKLRNAGIENVLMIDGAGYGQETSTLIERCTNVKAADPTGNIMFSIHMYSVAGKDAATVKSNIDSMLGKGVATCIGEFGDFQNGGDVDEETIINYSEEKKMGTIAWSWKGNGGTDITLDLSKDWEGKELTDWGKYVFHSTNGIQNTSKLAYTLKDFEGGSTGDVVEPPKPPVTDSDTNTGVTPDKDEVVNIDPGYLSSLKTEWYVSGEGDDTKSSISTIEELAEGGYRVAFDLSQEPYPYLVNMVNGLDLSSNKTISVIVRNNNSYAVQLQPIFKVGEEWEWTEYDQYQTIPALTTVQLNFDLSKCTREEVNAFLFRIQGAGGKFAGTVDFLSVACDLDESVNAGAIAELNRPKTASYFSWAFPEVSWVDQTTSATCDENGVLTVQFKNATSKNAAGIQTETKPGLGKGLDCTPYGSITCKITNNSAQDMSVSLVARASGNWTWQENAGILAGQPAGSDVIPAGETVEVTYDLTSSTWKSAASDWQYTTTLEDADDVRAFGFKVYPSGSASASGEIQISDLSFQF